LKEQENTNHLNEFVTNHKNFSKFIEEITFENYIKNYTNNNNNFDTKMDFAADNNEENALLIKLCKAISNPRVIQLINSLLINDDE
jgi:hypothetical protein